MIHIPEEHIDKYLQLFGEGNDQLDILQEECAELIKAISKYKRASDQNKALENVIEEITHVAISSEIVARILGISSKDIINEVNKKAIKYGMPTYEETKEDK